MRRMLEMTMFMLLVLALAVGIFWFTGYAGINSEGAREFDYIWTKAICDDNVCRDYEIKCMDGEVVDVSPVSGFVVFSSIWEDPREEDFREKYC